MRLFLVLMTLLAAAPSWGAESAPARSDNVTVRLISDAASVAPGEMFYVAIHKEIAPGWHTYWRNAGTAGESTEVAWDLPEGLTAGEIIWPAPTVYNLAGVVTNYIFEDELVLAVPFTVADTVAPGEALDITAQLYWQECADICIPVDNITLSLSVPVSEPGASGRDPQWAPRIDQALADAPAELGFEVGLARAGDVVQLSVADDALGAAIAEDAIRDPYFFPYEAKIIDYNAPQPAAFGERGFTLDLTPGSALRETLQPVAGVVAFEERRGGSWARRAVTIAADPGGVVIGAAPVGAAGAGSRAAGGGLGLGAVAGLVAASLLGGLILNLMPCVFPVLSIKALALVNKAHDAPGAARRQGLAFLAGVLATFTVFAGAILALQAAGQAVGWGFQLQSPVFVTALAVLMFAIGLNLLGFFEVGASLQGVGGGLAAQGGSAGAFFTGVLAVAVAAPCVGPFLGAPLGFALTQPPYVAIALFWAIGLGLAAPFVAVSVAPELLRALPKPGPWMETFKQALSFPMFLTAIWLVWTLAQQAGANGVGFALLAMTAVAFAVWAVKAAGGARGFGARAVQAGAALSLVVAGLAIVGAGAMSATASSSAPAVEDAAAAASDAWSPERVAALRAEGRPVFVDFTAAWCITCQANKRLTLTQPRVRAAFEKYDVAYLTADWTNRDPEIAATLADYGRAGVPLYLLLVDDREAITLPQLLTPQIVIAALEDAFGA